MARAPLRRAVAVTIGLLLAPAAIAADLDDPYFGEALYLAHQGRHFEALERLDTEIAQHHGVDEPRLDSFYAHIDDAEFSVGDLELRYRMHLRAGRAIRAVLEGDVPLPVRNDAAYRLARLHLQKNRAADALETLQRIDGPVPESIQDDVELLRANVWMTLGRPGEAAAVLEALEAGPDLQGFARYNLGIALLQDERPRQAVRQLDRAGRIDASDDETRAIRDKSNYVLGSMLLESEAHEEARRFLDRVRIEGPYSNQALLRAGWAEASAEQFERALVPWSLLAARETTDAAVQDALLALPHAYSRLGVHGRAAVLYEKAAVAFGEELVRIDDSLESIRQGRFLEALGREEIRDDPDWVIRLRSRPGTPETYYLTGLMASHAFHTALLDFLDLADLDDHLAAWEQGLEAFEDLVVLRRAYYEPRLPDLDRRFRQLDARIRLRLEQRAHLAERLEDMLTAPRPELLASSAEQAVHARLQHLAARVDAAPEGERPTLRRRIGRLAGALDWRLETDYHARLTRAHRHLRELDADVAALDAQYERFVRVRQAASHGFEGYARVLDVLRERVRAARQRIDGLRTLQGEALEVLATRELMARRERLEGYQNQARFAFADSYDRAAKAQAQAR